MKYFEGVLSEGPGTLAAHFVVQLRDDSRFPIPLTYASSAVLIEQIEFERFQEFLDIHGNGAPFLNNGGGNEAFYATVEAADAE